jgi:DNA-binding transcriptional LysR family regulator
MALDLRQLRVLRAVGDAGSFSAAAEALSYTQPAVSKIVAALERTVGTTLVDRGIRPLRLTDAGEALARGAGAALERLTAAEAEVEAIRQLDGGRLRLATFSSAGSAFVVDALRAFRREHPRVEVAVAEVGMPSTVVRRLRAGDFDLAIAFDYPDAGDDASVGLERHHLLDDPFDVVLPSGHRLAEHKRVDVRDLAAESWLLPDFGPSSPSYRLIARACGSAGFEPQVVYRINDCQMTQAMVAAGEGIALLPRLMLRPTHPSVEIRPLRADAPIRRISALRLPARHLSAASSRFLELLRSACARHAAPL